MALNTTLRAGRLDDAHILSELINYAGEGMPLYLWESMRENGETAWDVGRRRASRETGSFSYRNAVMAVRNGHVVGALIGYVIGDAPEQIEHDTPAMFVPLIELENNALKTWYVNVLAVTPEVRGLGVGSHLLDHADTIGSGLGKPGMSVIVSDANSGALRLYDRHGYEQTATQPMVKNGWTNDGENWVLLTKTF